MERLLVYLGAGGSGKQRGLAGEWGDGKSVCISTRGVWIFGFLEHLRRTRFPAPEFTSSGTVAFSIRLRLQARPTIARAKIGRIRA